MNVYMLETASGYTYFELADLADDEYHIRLKRPDPLDPPPPEIRVLWTHDTEAIDANPVPLKSDFPSFGGVVCFSERAVEVLRDLLEPNGDLYPLLTSDNERYYAFQVRRELEALDMTQCRLPDYHDSEDPLSNRYPSSGRIEWIEEFAFLPDCIPADAAIFKAQEGWYYYCYVTDAFVERVESSDLTGFEFYLLWSSSGGPVHKPLYPEKARSYQKRNR